MGMHGSSPQSEAEAVVHQKPTGICKRRLTVLHCLYTDTVRLHVEPSLQLACFGCQPGVLCVTLVHSLTCEVVWLPCCDRSYSSFIFGTYSACAQLHTLSLRIAPSVRAYGQASARIAFAGRCHTAIKCTACADKMQLLVTSCNVLDLTNLTAARKARGIFSRGIAPQPPVSQQPQSVSGSQIDGSTVDLPQD